MGESRLLSHELAYRGEKFQEIAAKPHIIVCGAGALGSNLIETLARIGFQKLTVIDDDRVEIHNVGTQVYQQTQVGTKKAQALRQMIFSATGVGVTPMMDRLTAVNVQKLLKTADLVVDCFDNSESRRVVSEKCKEKNIRCVHAGLFEDYGEVVWNSVYKIPKDHPKENDACDYPLSRTIVLLTVVALTESIISFLTTGQERNLSLTLKDMAIRKL
jgi:molybdopterin/thiamine biosynthesis adenylyltransferase